MTYTVLTRFADLQDGNRIYEAGDQYPRPGLSVSDERLAELAGSDNRMGRSLIKAVERPKQAAAEKGKEIPVHSVKTPEKPRRGRQRG